MPHPQRRAVADGDVRDALALALRVQKILHFGADGRPEGHTHTPPVKCAKGGSHTANSTYSYTGIQPTPTHSLHSTYNHSHSTLTRTPNSTCSDTRTHSTLRTAHTTTTPRQHTRQSAHTNTITPRQHTHTHRTAYAVTHVHSPRQHTRPPFFTCKIMQASAAVGDGRWHYHHRNMHADSRRCDRMWQVRKKKCRRAPGTRDYPCQDRVKHPDLSHKRWTHVHSSRMA